MGLPGRGWEAGATQEEEMRGEGECLEDPAGATLRGHGPAQSLSGAGGQIARSESLYPEAPCALS